MIKNRRAFIVGLKSLKLSNKEITFLKKYKPWGVILFSRNISSIEQTKKLTDKIKKIWPKENPFPYLYSSIEKYIKSNTEKSLLKTLKFHKVKKISYVLRALPNEIKGGIATSLIFSAWNAAVYVNQMTDEQIFKVQRSKNYQKIVQQILENIKSLTQIYKTSLT